MQPRSVPSPRTCEAPVGADSARGLETVHHRHLAIHQHPVVVGLDDLLQRFLAIYGDVDANSRVTEQFLRQFAIHVVVLDQQEMGAAQRFGRLA